MSDTKHEPHEEHISYYQTGDLTKTLGVSRASLLYYEQIGLINPSKNPETGLRKYTNEDIFKLFEFKALSNLGFTAREIISDEEQNSDLFDECHIEIYLKKVKDQLLFDEALRDSLDCIRLLRQRYRLGPDMLIETIEPYIFIEDGAENGYTHFHNSKELDALVACLPISGCGFLIEYNDDGDMTWKWGRTIPTRLSVIADINPKTALQIGGCNCITMINRTLDDTKPLHEEILKPLYIFAEEAGYIPCGNPFVPYSIPPYLNTPYLICLPIKDSE